MKVIIAGSRDIFDYDFVAQAIRCAGLDITEVVSGAAPGVDTLGEKWAEYRDVPVKKFPADWKQFGKSAGPRRNREMGAYAEALIAIPGPGSRGTLDMIEVANKNGLVVKVFNYPGPDWRLL